MLSFGIQFGRGFDAVTVQKLMQAVPVDFEYDLVVIGSNPGGVACAKEAGQAGKKTAIIKRVKYSPAELEGVDEDLNEMKRVLADPEDGNDEQTVSTSRTTSKTKWKLPSIQTERKVRRSRLDLSNEFFKRGEQCRKLMHNAIALGDLVENANNSGWRVTTSRPPFSINWNKMSEEMADFVMKENWELAKELSEQKVEVIEGSVSFKDGHTVRIQLPDMSETSLTSEFICIALACECILPEDVEGATEYGITCDDFIRLSAPPGKTLIVGSSAEAIECAGIIAGGRFPVTIVSRTKFLKDYDLEISDMIMDELRGKGVKFIEDTNLKSIEKISKKQLLAKFEPFSEGSEESVNSKEQFTDWFDTVLFAVGRKLLLEDLKPENAGVEVDPYSQKIVADGSLQTAVSNIYAVGDALSGCPEGMEISQLAGKLLGRRLFHDETQLTDFGLIPEVIYTPTEYGFVGLSEESAIIRLGKTCVNVYYGYFKPLDFVIPPQTKQCFAKIIVLKTDEVVIGLHIYGPQAGEIIQGFSAAVKSGLSMTALGTTVGVVGTTANEVLKLKEVRTMKVIEEILDPFSTD